MKKFISIILSFIMLYSVSIPALAYDNETLKKISDTFGIPIEALETLDDTTLQSLANDAQNNPVVSSETVYVKISEDTNGNISMEESTYSEYINEQQQSRGSANNTDSSSGWMQFHLTISDINSDTGQAACAFTWLTPPSPRLADVVGISLRQGTLDYNTSNGFYSHVSELENYSHTFTRSELEESGYGVTVEFNLRTTDVISQRDYVFLRANFSKVSGSEGLNGTYAHKKFGLSFNPTFSINRNGEISISGGLNITTYYTQETGYVSTNW